MDNRVNTHIPMAKCYCCYSLRKKSLIDLLPMYVTKFKSQTHERKNDNTNTKQKFNSMDSSTTVNHDHL